MVAISVHPNFRDFCERDLYPEFPAPKHALFEGYRPREWERRISLRSLGRFGSKFTVRNSCYILEMLLAEVDGHLCFQS